MRAASEADVLAGGLAPEVELIRFRELRGVTVRGADDGDDEVAAADRLTAELDVGRRPARDRPLDRAVVAQELLDGGWHERRVGAERVELVRVGRGGRGRRS